MTDRATRGGIKWWQWALAPLMAALPFLAFFWAQDLKNFPDPPTARIIFWHVPMAWLSLLWFLIGAVYGGWLLFAKRAPVSKLDLKSALANEIGLLCTILTTVTGMVFAYRQWQTAWNWDPRQVSIVVLIVMYLAYFALRLSLDDARRRMRLCAVYSIIGAIAAPFIFFVVPKLAIIETLHPDDQVIIGGLDDKWKTIYWLGVAGFLGITTWLFQLRLRTAALEEAMAHATVPSESTPATQAVRRPRPGDATLQTGGD